MWWGVRVWRVSVGGKGDGESVRADGGGVQCDGEDKLPHVVLKSCKESLKLLLFSPLKLATHLHIYQHTYTHQ